MALDWSQPLQTRDGAPAELRPREQWQRPDDLRRRVSIPNVRPYTKEIGTTVYLVDEDGHVRGDKAESPNDIQNVPAAARAA